MILVNYSYAFTHDVYNQVPDYALKFEDGKSSK